MSKWPRPNKKCPPQLLAQTISHRFAFSLVFLLSLSLSVIAAMRRCAALLRRSWSSTGGGAGIGGFRRQPQFLLPLPSYADVAQRAIPSMAASTFAALSLPRTFSSASSPSGALSLFSVPIHQYPLRCIPSLASF